MSRQRTGHVRLRWWWWWLRGRGDRFQLQTTDTVLPDHIPLVSACTAVNAALHVRRRHGTSTAATTTAAVTWTSILSPRIDVILAAEHVTDVACVGTDDCACAQAADVIPRRLRRSTAQLQT